MGFSVEVSGLCKSFLHADGAKVRVLQDVSLTLNDLTFTTLIGPSGSGKTTLLNIISGLEPAEHGQVRASSNGTILPLDTLTVGRVFQEPRLLPWQTVYENVQLVLAGSPWTRERREHRIREFLQLVKLWMYRDYYPRQLSGGMQQRVAIARAFVIEPALLLLDEPFSSLDELMAHELSRELYTCWEYSPTTILFVTHNLFDAVILSDRVLYLDGRTGRISHDWKIDLPRPRDPSQPQVIERYLEMRRAIGKIAASGAGS
jgi:NitT/TauT family transport system ATP-binding protein